VKQLNKCYLITISLLILFLFKIPFLFHGTWDNKFFTPYMTDANVIMSPIFSYLTAGTLNLGESLKAYPPLTFNLLFFPFYLLSKTIPTLFSAGDPIKTYQIIYYTSRIFVAFITTLGIYFYIKTFSELIKSKAYQWLLAFFVSLTPLIFIYSLYVKTDNLVWATGAITLFTGLKFHRQQTKKNFFVFLFFSILPMAINYYGVLYFLIFVLVNLTTLKSNFMPIYQRILLIIFATPLVWFTLNFELLFNFSIILNKLPYYTISLAQNNMRIPYLEGANGYSAFSYYLQYLNTYLAPPILILVATTLFLLKTKGSYFKTISFGFLLFFAYMSIAGYRTDRLFLPIFIFFGTTLIYSLYFIYSKIDKKLKAPILLLSLAFVVYHLWPTINFARFLPGKDTRQLAYDYIRQNIPVRSQIHVPYLTIASAFNIGQRLSLDEDSWFKVFIYNLDHDQFDPQALNSLQGYFILSTDDYNVLKQNSNTDLYNDQYRLLNTLIGRSEVVTVIDKVGYSNNPLKDSSLYPNSLYGIHNPALTIYKTNDTLPPAVSFTQSKDPYQLNINTSQKNVNLDLSNLISDDQELSLTIRDQSLTIDSPNGVTVKGRYLNGKEAFGFADPQLSGRHFLFTTWVKANRQACITPGFYEGNINAIVWGRHNITESQGEYELIYLEDNFDDPYSLNGNIFYKIQPGCKVEIVQPQFFTLNDQN